MPKDFHGKTAGWLLGTTRLRLWLSMARSESNNYGNNNHNVCISYFKMDHRNGILAMAVVSTAAITYYLCHKGTRTIQGNIDPGLRTRDITEMSYGIKAPKKPQRDIELSNWS